METIKASELYRYLVNLGNVVYITDDCIYDNNSDCRPIKVGRRDIKMERYFLELYEKGLLSKKPGIIIKDKFKVCEFVRILDTGFLISDKILMKLDILDEDKLCHENDKIYELLMSNIRYIFENFIDCDKEIQRETIDYKTLIKCIQGCVTLINRGTIYSCRFIDFEKVRKGEM